MTEDDLQCPRASLVTLRRDDLDELITRAAEMGAKRALDSLGLENGSAAARDIRELRELLDTWRETRRTAWRTMIKATTTAILTLLVVGVAIKLKLMGGGP